MKKRILLALLLGALLSFPEVQGQSMERIGEEKRAETIRPMGEAVDPTDPPDGVYHARFAPEDLIDGILSFHLYVQDRYEDADIQGLSVGDSIVIRGETVPVQTLERSEQLISINGGLQKAGGYELYPYEEEGCWKVVTENDHHTYTEQGEPFLPFADEITFRDARMLYQPATVITGAEAVIEAIETSFQSFTELDTSLTVEEGAIVRIDSWYIP